MKNSGVIVTLGFYLLIFSAFSLLTAAFFLRLFCSVEQQYLDHVKGKKIKIKKIKRQRLTSNAPVLVKVVIKWFHLIKKLDK